MKEKPNQDFFISFYLLDLIQQVTGQDAKTILSYFWDKSRECTTYPPNVRGYGDNDVEKRMWCYKDYYPNSPIFFKMLVVDPIDSENGYGNFIFTKITTPDRKAVMKDCLNLNRQQLEKMMETTVLGTEFSIETKTHRRMAPKGMKYA